MQNKDLTKGNIFSTLLRLSVPIAGAQVIQMAYNLTDMFWLGRVSGDAVAAAGAAGMFMWLAVGLLMIGRIGAEVGVAQARGRGENTVAYDYSRAAIFIAFVLGILYGAFLFIFRDTLVGFLNFYETHVATDTVDYIAVIAFGMPAMYVSAAVTGTFVSSGNARTPFLINGGGLIFNMLLTPFFIFVLDLGVVGAAASSSIAKIAVMIVNLIAIKRFKSRPFSEYYFFDSRKIYDTVKEIFKIAWPVSLENTVWPLFTLAVVRLEVGFGSSALAMSRVGTQVESLSWLVGAGFGAALTAFVGQNFGAGRFDRISKGVKCSVGVLITWGAIVSIILWFGGGIIFQVFLPHYSSYIEMRNLFVTYLRILAIAQIFANMEYVGSNAFRGMGQTLPPSVVSISSNIIRIPLAFALSLTGLGILGVWAAVAFTSALRGIGSCTWYYFKNRKDIKRAIS